MPDSTRRFRDLRTEQLKALKPRERILKTAIALFNEYGVHTIGVDRIIADSGVSKRSFYDYYPSKADLIAAYLDFWEEFRFANLEKHLKGIKGGPVAEILAVFDAVDDWIGQADFKGCTFTRGLSDFNTDDSKPLREKIDRHFEKFSDLIKSRLVGLTTPKKKKTLLLQLMSLIVGAMAVAHATGEKDIAQLNKKIAKDLLSE
ncbi:MAG TPA: TetR/AcrR family transcriptional regulator [Puia sp.]|jgi:AcrR family transcriptional regulator|nr:TetR/AcrR family transcriptional regulator [Puia sp.]